MSLERGKTYLVIVKNHGSRPVECKYRGYDEKGFHEFQREDNGGLFKIHDKDIGDNKSGEGSPILSEEQHLAYLKKKWKESEKTLEEVEYVYNQALNYTKSILREKENTK